MSAPTFRLAPCPLCSTPRYAESPVWKHARNTSRARGRECYFFVGCAHAAAVFPSTTIVDESKEWAAIENAWSLRAEELFADKTKTWDDVAREKFRRAINGSHTLPGATEPLKLST